MVQVVHPIKLGKLLISGVTCTPTFIVSGITTLNIVLNITHASTIFNAAYGGLYVYNPNNNAVSSCSVLAARIAGSIANKAGISSDVDGIYFICAFIRNINYFILVAGDLYSIW